ncbi:MAG: iron-sulfur cluster assembly accessory protein [Armatimonadota bacterium]|nr:iron-sulfur cluster assembly accessory protein [Armatimonadota bacterium]MDR5676371.1 iron-sulfur cluster assembly accessory protein [Armatimonadota bacterium]MDR5690090.1 iron-sulfur cluster assembly accessory protein [Armatimonadota bacterium]MDR7388005.1 iron-sulfur cluster assembly accessory protein [Armatimonadota bacterium]MDR7389400.1 iron-sulfur cluster assembly accessory protein [Armatimonadota bacterium]
MITLTEVAAQKIRELMADQPGEVYLRLFVTKGGCEGFTYGMGFDDRVQPDDRVTEQYGIRLVVDPLTWRVMDGARIDYRQTPFGEGFAVHNPRAVATCGCGHSFKTADDAGEAQPCEEARQA